jgi:hypothetical protein
MKLQRHEYYSRSRDRRVLLQCLQIYPSTCVCDRMYVRVSHVFVIHFIQHERSKHRWECRVRTWWQIAVEPARPVSCRSCQQKMQTLGLGLVICRYWWGILRLWRHTPDLRYGLKIDWPYRPWSSVDLLHKGLRFQESYTDQTLYTSSRVRRILLLTIENTCRGMIHWLWLSMNETATSWILW